MAEATKEVSESGDEVSNDSGSATSASSSCGDDLKSVRVHFAYGRIALTLELLGRFGRFLDEDDRHSHPVLLVPFSRLLGL